MNRRYRICSRCHKRWNVSCIGANPKDTYAPTAKRKRPCPDCHRKHGHSKKHYTSIVED